MFYNILIFCCNMILITLKLKCAQDIFLFLQNPSLMVCENATNHQFFQLGLKIISYTVILQRFSINLGVNYSIRVTQKMDHIDFPFKRQESPQIRNF